MVCLYHAIQSTRGSHDELALQVVFLLLFHYLLLADLVALVEQRLEPSLRKLHSQLLLEIPHLADPIPVNHVELELLQLVQFFKQRSHKLLDLLVQSFYSEEHDEIEGELDELFGYSPLDLIHLFNQSLVLFYALRLLNHLDIDLVPYPFEGILVLFAHAHVVVEDLQQHLFIHSLLHQFKNILFLTLLVLRLPRDKGVFAWNGVLDSVFVVDEMQKSSDLLTMLTESVFPEGVFLLGVPLVEAFVFYCFDDCFLGHCFFEQIVGLQFVHVEGGEVQSESSDVMVSHEHDVVGEVVELIEEFLIGEWPRYELPGRYFQTYFEYLPSRDEEVDEWKHFAHHFDLAVAQVASVEPHDLNVSVVLIYQIFNQRDDLQETPVFNAETKVLDFEYFQAGALEEGVREVAQEVVFHVGLESGVLIFEVAVAEALQVEFVDVLWLYGDGEAFDVFAEVFEAGGFKEGGILL